MPQFTSKARSNQKAAKTKRKAKKAAVAMPNLGNFSYL